MHAPDERAAWLSKELGKAYVDARRGKTKKPEVEKFDKIAKSELVALAQEIHTRTYTPRPSTAFIVNKPIQREIFAAAFRDRVVMSLKPIYSSNIAIQIDISSTAKLSLWTKITYLKLSQTHT